jgi:uncharacterized protein YjbI with pentapeptide repeats
MANPEHIAVLEKGIKTWNQWRREPAGQNVDLSGANLSRARLMWANLSRANLSRANLKEANLGGANLYRADLSRANLSRAFLREANLSRAGLMWANLGGANLAEAVVGWTSFGAVDLSTVKGLDNLIHQGPSSIDIQTIYLSEGTIRDIFLRGAGVPDNFISYIKSLVGNPIEFYSCFISYATKDQEFANRLHADLQAHGVRCWLASHNIQGGKKIHEQIDEAIQVHDRLLLILSEHSINSEWVKTEIAKARKREISEKRRMLFPISLVPFEKIRTWKNFDGDTGKDSAREIREYFIPDFSRWKTDHGAYQREFEKLLRDLKAETKTASAGLAPE